MRLAPALAALLATHVLFFHDILFAGRSLSPATFTSGLTPSGPFGAPSPPTPPHLLDVEGAAWVDEPSPYLAASGWRALEPPLWTPAEGLGAPLAANLNSGAANPLHLPLALWPGPLAFDLFALARLALLGIGTTVFLRELTLAPVATLAGAVATAYGGYAMAWIVHHPLSAELFLPFMLVGFERGRRGARGGWIVLALATAGSFVGGKLQASVLCVALVAAYAIVRSTRGHGGAGRATRGAAAVTAALGIALAAYLLVPAAELMARASGLTLGGRSALAGFTQPWPTLAAVALPRLFIPSGQAVPDGLPLPPAIGVVATVLALVGVAARRSPHRRVARFFALWAALLLLRNAGAFGREWMTMVPVVRGIFFLKYTFTAAFALAVAAAIGLDAVARGLVSFPRRAPRPTLEQPARRTARVPAWTATLLLVAMVLELRLVAPAVHPPRLDPYRRPPYVEFLRGAPRARVLGADGFMTPLTSAAVGLRDLRAIDVLTPGTTYAFFTRLVSFCSRIIHFTVDPDLPLAATAPAVDLAGVRWIVSRGELDFGDLDARVTRQIGHERLARLLAGLRALRTAHADLALGTIESAGESHFALSLTTPFALELEAESEAPVLAWDLHVADGGARVTWRIETTPGGASDVARGVTSATGSESIPAASIAGTASTTTAASATGPDSTTSAASAADAEFAAGRFVSTRGSVDVGAAPEWKAARVALGVAGVRRRVRIRIAGERAGAGRARVDLGDLGFSDGPGADAARLATALARHRDEVRALVPVFRDDAVGAVVYENRNALPRAFRVAAYERVASVEAALTRLADGFDFRTGALVTATDATLAAAEHAAAAAMPRIQAAHDHPPPAPTDAPAPGGIGAASGGAPAWSGTTIVKDDAESVVVATDGAERALVVLADLDYPGWWATIDGRPAPILTTDGVLRGVLVPPGPHCLEYRYQPRSWLVGLVVTVLAALLLPACARRAAGAHRKIVPAFARVV